MSWGLVWRNSGISVLNWIDDLQVVGDCSEASPELSLDPTGETKSKVERERA